MTNLQKRLYWSDCTLFQIFISNSYGIIGFYIFYHFTKFAWNDGKIGNVNFDFSKTVGNNLLQLLQLIRVRNLYELTKNLRQRDNCFREKRYTNIKIHDLKSNTQWEKNLTKKPIIFVLQEIITDHFVTLLRLFSNVYLY